MKIGIFGGTFDPIHIAHLLLAEWIKEEFNLSKIIFVPAATPPHKQNQKMTPPLLRLQMVQLAIQRNPVFEASNFEIEKGDISYSIDTIHHFRQRHQLPAKQLFFIIGADSLLELTLWRNPEQILRDCQVVVYQRRGYDITKAKKKFLRHVILLDNPIIEISSSTIRQYIADGHSIKYMVPVSVEEFIFKKALYVNGQLQAGDQKSVPNP